MKNVKINAMVFGLEQIVLFLLEINHSDVATEKWPLLCFRMFVDEESCLWFDQTITCIDLLTIGCEDMLLKATVPVVIDIETH